MHIIHTRMYCWTIRGLNTAGHIGPQQRDVGQYALVLAKPKYLFVYVYAYVYDYV